MVPRRAAVILAAVLMLCFTLARLVDRPMTGHVAPLATRQSAARWVVRDGGEACGVVEMAAMLCLDTRLGTPAGGVPRSMPVIAWSIVAAVCFVTVRRGRGLFSRHARASGPTRQAHLQRFQL